MKKILIIQTAFLGDVVLATAVAENLHKWLPNASLSILVREGNESLFNNHPFLKNVIVWKKNDGKFKNLFNIIGKVRSEKFDIVINLQRFFSTGLITALSGSPVRSGFDKNPLSLFFTNKAKHVIGDGRHEVDRNLALTAFLCEPIVRKPRLYPSAEDENKTAALKTKSYITIAPASVWFTKQLPVEKWVELIKNVPKEIIVYLIGAPSDKLICQKIIDASATGNAINLSGELGLLQTASLMKDAHMNYVNDSGPLHIASAMNAKVSAFFCSTVPAFGFGPLSDNSIIIETKEKLDCRPCGLHGWNECPRGHFKCALTISIPKMSDL